MLQSKVNLETAYDKAKMKHNAKKYTVRYFRTQLNTRFYCKTQNNFPSMKWNYAFYQNS